jgi:hypothetical protein
VAEPLNGPGGDSIEVVPVVVLSQIFPARPSSIPDIRDFVRRCLAESPLTEQGTREVGETVFRALLDAAGPTGCIQVAFRIFPEHVEVDVLHSEMTNATWIHPVGPAASSRARKTVSPTSLVPSSVSGDSARQRRTKSLISGIDDGRAGKIWESTTTGTTSIESPPGPFKGSATGLSLRHVPAQRGRGTSQGTCNELKQEPSSDDQVRGLRAYRS